MKYIHRALETVQQKTWTICWHKYMSCSSIWLWYSPLSGYTVVEAPGTKPEQEVHWMIKYLFVLPQHQQQQLCSRCDKTFTQLTNNHRYSKCDFNKDYQHLLSHLFLKAYHNKEMILIKEVMVNMRTQTNTHTPFSSHFLVLWHWVAVWGKFLLPCAWKFALIFDLKC